MPSPPPWSLARSADRLGYRRYWIAEHHNMPAVAATNPPILIGMIAGATERIRVGSGGVMLPNHAPLVVAEQFALLEAAYPGRVDLGIGRAPGSDPVTSLGPAARRRGSGGGRGGPLPGVRRQRARDDGAGRCRAGPAWWPARAARDPVRAVGARGLAAGVLGLLRAARRGEGAALRLRPPLLRLRHRRGPRGSTAPPSRPRPRRRPRGPSSRSTPPSPTPPRRRTAEPCRSLLQMLALRTGQPLIAQRTIEDAETIVAAGLTEAQEGDHRGDARQVGDRRRGHGT
ncbi:MsnO8 family LLM class oxidoreductase [Nocardioides convexus]|uniref:MsnO8 family LLM class oxidoreductase n=1 Tax=Nocardioides convexus TaxID=2712224 RepID=UPI002418B656|nr:MsnO8 family LLM class oxidoreductase [Nocardioides convexus]